MTAADAILRLGCRSSDLAQRQAGQVADALRTAWPDLQLDLAVFTTSGDRQLDQPLPAIGGKGVFTAELEQALRQGQIDMAVHSLKDLPTQEAPGLSLGAIPFRQDAADVLVAANRVELEALPPQAVVGTSSLRRQAQLLNLRPDLTVRSIRGNVETRVRKVLSGEYQAAVLAAAGLLRLGLDRHITTRFSADQMMPAPGQGALAVQQRTDDRRISRLLAAIDRPGLRQAVEAERAFLRRLEAGCSAPVGALATAENGMISMQAAVFPLDGSSAIRLHAAGADPDELGTGLADTALRQGAAAMLSHVE
jgi:hydroxymethylbilane synthase